MPDREKVIAWLADEELYYRDHGDTHNSLMACDALALLKEQEAAYQGAEELLRQTTILFSDAIKRLKKQEAVKPMKQIEQAEWTVCGCCRKHLISKWVFCPYCGKAVKWDGT